MNAHKIWKVELPTDTGYDCHDKKYEIYSISIPTNIFEHSIYLANYALTRMFRFEQLSLLILSIVQNSE
jgi:hypothetical protein